MKSFLFLCLVVCLLRGEVTGQDVKEEFEKSEIVPDILDTAPEELITVNFPKNYAKLGNELTVTEVNTQPEIQWESSPDTYHTLLMVDADALSRENPTLRSVQHWMVVNVPGSDVSKGDARTAFIPSAPPKDTGLHRYVLITFEQEGKLEFDEPEIPSDSVEARFNFSIRDFQKKYGFKGPKAGNFYLTQSD